MADSPKMAEIRLKTITSLAEQMEVVLLEQVERLKPDASEVRAELQKAKQKIMEQKADEKVSSVETNRQVDEVFDDLKNLENFWDR
jgi:phage shock protein A